MRRAALIGSTAGIATAGGTTLVVFNNDESLFSDSVLLPSLKALRARLEAADRATALAGTVGCICLDYARHNSATTTTTTTTTIAAARSELAAAQLNQEHAGIELELALGRGGGALDGTDSSGAAVRPPPSLEAARAAAAKAKARMISAAADLAAAEEASGGVTSAVHSRNAKRLIAMARRNGGCYLKLAQHLAQLSHLLPPEYVAEAATCLDDCPTSSLADVRAVVEAEFGAPPEDLFDDFSHVPIASASLAQVHTATVRAGGPAGAGGRRKVAIKVQHRGLRETCVGDLEACSLACRLVARAFPAFKLEWLVDEIAPHLPVELDFKNEAKNCRRAAAIFADDADVAVPEVLAATPRVLVMSFEEGVNGTDVEAMRRAGIDTPAAARLVGRSWLRQTFNHGFVHCDPHAGNVLVRPLKPGKSRPQIVLLDHGLYRELDSDFRLRYAEMWRSLVMGDGPGIEAAARALGVGDHYPLFSAILTQRPWDDIIAADIDSLRGNRGAADDAVIRAHAQKYLPEITEVLNACPRQLLLLLKMTDCLRNIDRSLGATHNQHVATADVCCDLLLNASDRKTKDLWQWATSKLRLRAYEAGRAVSRLRN